MKPPLPNTAQEKYLSVQMDVQELSAQQQRGLSILKPPTAQTSYIDKLPCYCNTVN